MKYALALAGGGTRGAFQVGVWQALSELGIEISAIAGTSVGAVNGAVFASGGDAERLWKTIDARDIADVDRDNILSLPSLVSALKRLPHGGIDTSPFARLLSECIDENRLRRSGIDYGLCTFCTDTKKSVEKFIGDIPDGELIPYILASASFPLFKPTIIDGAEYRDGGILNNLPEDMLIARGYDTIISVSVKGPGVVRPVDRCGVNIIKINCKSPEVGVLDFDRNAIADSIQNGYFECMRTFGRYCGRHYSIDSASYSSALAVFGSEIVNGLELAAKMCEIDPYKVYTFDELAKITLRSYRNNRKLRLMCSAMEKSVPGRGLLDSLGAMFRAANAIVYLKRHI